MSYRTKQYRKAQRSFSDFISNKGIKVKAKVSKLDPELKAKWVAELRSGKYKQNTGRLKVVDPVTHEACHCCLGVLCEIVAPNGFKVIDDSWGMYSHSFDGSPSKQESYPNQNKMKELGLYPSTYKALAAMNDGETAYHHGKNEKKKKHTFAEIADYIEENL